MTAAHMKAVGAACAIYREMVGATDAMTALEGAACVLNVAADINNRMAIIRASVESLGEQGIAAREALADIEEAIAATCRIAAALTGGARDDATTKEG